MKILLLSPYPEKLINAFGLPMDAIHTYDGPIDDNFVGELGADWIVSFGYRHIIKGNVLDTHRNKIINLHISYLPWNAGADPNFWSFFDDTPKGVTIHWVNAGIDTGEIIAQRKVEFSEGETLATSFSILQNAIIDLFEENWPLIRNGVAPSIRQPSGGSYHRTKDKEPYFSLLKDGWNTQVQNVMALGKKRRAHESG